MDNEKICVLLACHNRVGLTLRALGTIDDAGYEIDYFVIDDASVDGTEQAVRSWADSANSDKGTSVKRMSRGNLCIEKGNGHLYWSGAMRLGMEKLLEQDNRGLTSGRYDYLLMINDDIEFYPGTIHKMIEISRKKGNMPVSGITHGSDGNVSYGGVVYDMKKAKPRFVTIEEADIKPCDTMNCNCFLLPWPIFKDMGAFDSHYVHSMADFDYGFSLKKKGYQVWLTDFYVGKCDDNSIEGSWRDNSLGRIERLKRKESKKGLPFGQWWYFLNKNFGPWQALWHSLTPYLRIALGK